MNSGADTYHLLAALSLRHPYFGTGRPNGLALSADAASAALMARFDLKWRAANGTVELYVRDSQLSGLWSERASWPEGGLVFTLHSSDSLCAYYTDLGALAAAGTFRAGAESGPLQPDGSGFAGGNGVLSRLVLPLAPPGCPSLDAWQRAEPSRYSLSIPVRRTVWKYLLLGDWRGELRIVDVAAGIDFSTPCRETLPDGRETIAIRSQGEIALQERPTHRFQLRQKGGNTERVLLARLPLAEPRNLLREAIDGTVRDVSEIFINA
ncbi:hypothetical protein [Paludibacterium purpuratum]|uniref:Uncharacterized protein n=1 Tax=Paludibacterium purpuratum TaxID=1144873 RepID=A0A4R7BG81_9NEIS|nr:hypothetical protein [Paludibacterium purpuratum]TDR82767.1 hypothetical protein DFP86_101156 [Paludibacterium purpuratum]